MLIDYIRTSVVHAGGVTHLRRIAAAVFPHAYRFADGMLHPGKEPGLGVALDHDRAARYAYRRACLPVNRLEDGSMFDW